MIGESIHTGMVSKKGKKLMEFPIKGPDPIKYFLMEIPLLLLLFFFKPSLIYLAQLVYPSAALQAELVTFLCLNSSILA